MVRPDHRAIDHLPFGMPTPHFQRFLVALPGLPQRP
jgi:hypothetical protein